MADIKEISHIFLRIRRLARTVFPNLAEQRHDSLAGFRNESGAGVSGEFAMLARLSRNSHQPGIGGNHLPGKPFAESRPCLRPAPADFAASGVPDNARITATARSGEQDLATI